jgi:DNA-binding IclR family transcriptional regulator
MPQASREVDLTQSVLKALDVLECLASANQPLSAQDVAQRCDLSRPTTYRLLVTLLTRGYVKSAQNSARYQIGARALSLGRSFLDHPDLSGLAKASMCKLNQISNETVHLAILDGTDMLYVGKTDSPQSVRMHSTIGTRNALHCTAVGKAVLAFLSMEERAALLDKITLAPHTPNTITDRAALEKHLELVRAQGFAIDDVENEEGIRCVGAPIFDHLGRAIAAISISGPAYRLSKAQLEALSKAVIQAGRAVSAELGHVSDGLPQ